MLKAYYTTKEAADLTGASAQIVRAYTIAPEYQRYFSSEATPEKGSMRRFTAADLRLIAFVYMASTEQALTREQVAQALAGGALDQFEWQLPEPDQPEAESQQSAQAGSEALVPVARLQAAQYLVEQAQQREQAMADQLTEAQAKIEQLSQDLGAARGELAGFQRAQYKAPAWWRSLFGGRASE